MPLAPNVRFAAIACAGACLYGANKMLVREPVCEHIGHGDGVVAAFSKASHAHTSCYSPRWLVLPVRRGPFFAFIWCGQSVLSWLGIPISQWMGSLGRMGWTGSHPYASIVHVSLLCFSTTTGFVHMEHAVASGVALNPLPWRRGQPFHFQMGSCTEAAIVNSSACIF